MQKHSYVKGKEPFPIPTHPTPAWNVGDSCGQHFHLETGPGDTWEWHSCVHAGGCAGAHRCLAPRCVCIPLGAAGHSWQQSLQHEQGRISASPTAGAGMCNTGCKSWQAQQLLFGSGYFSVLCLWYNALLSCAQAPLPNPLLVFYSVCLLWVWSPGTCQQQSGGTQPHFSHGAHLATLVGLDGFAVPQHLWFIICLLLAASSGYTCDPWCQHSVPKTIRKNNESKAHFSLKSNVYTPNGKKGEMNPIFYMNSPNRTACGDFPWRMSRCSCTPFVPSACCTEHIACSSKRRGPSCSSSGTAACLDGKLRLWCIFILYIFVYINYIAMLWTQILLYLLVSVSYKKKEKKKWFIMGDFFFFFFHRKLHL